MSYMTSSRENAAALGNVDGLEIVRDGDEGGGWLFFAGSVLGIAGLMRIIDAIWAFSYDGDLPARLQDGVLGDSLTTYAWTFLGVGVLLILASFLVVTRNQFGRWVGMIAAGVAMVSAITWIPYYPVWSLVYILLAMCVLYGLAVYGGRGEPV